MGKSVHGYPMHGYTKLLREGFRTRDGHLIEWMAPKVQLGGDSFWVHSRPEPLYTKFTRTRPATESVKSEALVHRDPISLRVPYPFDRQRWWLSSRNSYSIPTPLGPIITWNPILALSNIASTMRNSGYPIHFDLLDDWTAHFAFRRIREPIKSAYSSMLKLATSVSANSEATLALAREHGRSDARLILNGCDPQRFDQTNRATGAITIGYVGKIGRRIDLRLVMETTRALPDYTFVFAGPILDSEYKQPLSGISNIILLGDVHYQNIPQLLSSFDVGWVPHGTGPGAEVGGDVIKIYEYRAAGLPVLTTPILGRGRGLTHVTVAEAGLHAGALKEIVGGQSRVRRRPEVIPSDMQWESKANEVLSLLGL